MPCKAVDYLRTRELPLLEVERQLRTYDRYLPTRLLRPRLFWSYFACASIFYNLLGEGLPQRRHLYVMAVL
jgi:hypothetical protein